MQQITPAQLKRWLDDAKRDKPVLLDVREPWEFEKARIEGSTLMPMREIQARIGEIDDDSGSGGDLPPRRPQHAGRDVPRKTGVQTRAQSGGGDRCLV